MDTHGNINAAEGCDRCYNCGCKYWENDKCIDCGMLVEISKNREYAQGAALMASHVIQWGLDSLGLICGTVEVYEAPNEPLTRRLRNTSNESDEFIERPVRMIPAGADQNGQNWCILVRDVA